MRFRRAFTFVEVMIVAAVLGIILAFVLVSLRSFRARSNRDRARQDIESVLKLARSKTLASENKTYYGVLFQDNSPYYKLCKSPAYSGGSSDCSTALEQYTLPSPYSFCAANNSAQRLGLQVQSPNPIVIFERITGKFSNLDTGAYQEGSAIAYDTVLQSGDPCTDQPTANACLFAKQCLGVTITKDGVIYQIQDP